MRSVLYRIEGAVYLVALAAICAVAMPIVAIIDRLTGAKAETE